MSYISVEEVQAEFKSITFAASTAISSAKVAQFISTEEALLNAKIAGVYQTPVTGGSDALNLMRMLSLLSVRARILPIIAVKTGKDDLDQGGASDLREFVQEQLDGIREGEIILVDAALAETGGGVASYTSDNSIESEFKKDTQQW